MSIHEAEFLDLDIYAVYTTDSGEHWLIGILSGVSNYCMVQPIPAINDKDMTLIKEGCVARDDSSSMWDLYLRKPTDTGYDFIYSDGAGGAWLRSVTMN